LKPDLSAEQTTRPGFKEAAIIATLILSGEAIFLLPFILPRIFRPTFLEVFDLTNFELGVAYSVYGLVAIGAYFLGGPIADRFPARNLMTAAMLSTGLGGIYLLTIPTFTGLCLVYGFWGLTTILLFWSAMLRATRIWGGKDRQGLAYGLLDGGRGLVAALVASVSVIAFASVMAADITNDVAPDKGAALITVVLIFTATTLVTAAIIWLAIPSRDSRMSTSIKNDRLKWSAVLSVMTKPAVWLNAVIVLCAYVSFKSIDDFSLYVNIVHGYDDVEAAQFGTVAFWIRPVAALAAGILADRFKASWIVSFGFGFVAIGSVAISIGLLPPGTTWTLIATIVVLSIGIYAVRGVYFALVAESQIPIRFTGTAIGIVSTVGFLPDVFMGPVMGYFLDHYPGEAGHRLVFGLVGAFALVGFLTSYFFRKVTRHNQTSALAPD